MKKQANITIEKNGKAEVIPCYMQANQLFKRDGKHSWRARKTIKGRRKEFSSNHIDKPEAHRDINSQCHDFWVEGKRTETKRSAAPTLTEIAVAYLSAPPSAITASQDTRKTNLYALKVVTREMVTGNDPVIRKDPDGSYKLIDGGFWDKVRLDKLNKKVGKAFLDSRMVGYQKKTAEWNERACGANDYLRQARGVFTQRALDEVYEEDFKMPDLEDKKTGFLKVHFLPTRKKKWKAPSQSIIDQIYDKVPALEKEDPDVYACFVLQYGAGLSWGEAMHSQYSSLGIADSPNTDGTTRYTITVKPVEGWVPKCEDRERSATIPENFFQKLLDLRYAPRVCREDRKSLVSINDQDLAKRVWSESLAAIGKSFGVSGTTIKNHCLKRGIPTPPNGFWTKVRTGLVAHPKGEMPNKERTRFLLRNERREEPKDDFILQRHRCYGKSGANRRLARWFRENIIGWDRKQVGHELRKLNISRVICATNSVLKGSKHAGHSSTKVTESTYLDVLKHSRVDIPFPGT